MQYIIILLVYLINIVCGLNYVKILSGLELNIDRNDALITQQIACTDQLDFYYDKDSAKWVYTQTQCLKTQMDILSYCQRVYPKLNVINILRVQENIQIKYCLNDCKNSENKEINANLYKCLYGAYKSTQQLYIPPNCQFQHSLSVNECKSIEIWKHLADNKCKLINNEFVLTNSSVMLQWCDAFKGGISTFNGIEFVCCPNKKEVKVRLEDDNIDDQEADDSNESNSREIDSFEQKIELNKDGKANEFERVKSKDSHSTFFNYVSSFFLLGFFMTIFAFAIYLFVNRKTTKSNNVRVNLDDEMLGKNPSEDSQLNSMQINGYENPTYKFFDDQNRVV
ncbi:unnamed protein product [Brachionus calyciflorus]|uniref:E1 domain-containing protein n=1 Tax=Brachionus calyciflorus TaxID=104777 RepID=A0A814BHN1_9BILA|nr:unnamed protein product [Brachionus calyciflorus]